MYLFGKNNNHLIKNNYKNTFSLPQKIKLIQKQIIKCSCGFDFIIVITKDHNVYCYYQSAIYNLQISQKQKIIDIATQQNLILLINQKGQLLATDFIPEKLITGTLKPKTITLTLSFKNIKSKFIKKVTPLKDFIFLQLEGNQIVYLKKNDWLQTNSFSDPHLIKLSKSHTLIQAQSSKDFIYLLTNQGTVFSSKNNQFPLVFEKLLIQEQFKKISCDGTNLLAINQQGSIVEVNLKRPSLKSQKLFKVSAQFTDLISNNSNHYAITADQQVWVWGKNGFGQLGLSDYEPRTSLYPLISLQAFYVKNIFLGQNFTCCLIDSNRVRQSAKTSYRSNSVKEQYNIFYKNYVQEGQSSMKFEQSEQDQLPPKLNQQKQQEFNRTNGNIRNSILTNSITSNINNKLSKVKIEQKKSELKLKLSDRKLIRPKGQNSSCNKYTQHSVSANKNISFSAVSKQTPKSGHVVCVNSKQCRQRSQNQISNTKKSCKKVTKKQMSLQFNTPNKITQKIDEQKINLVIQSNRIHVQQLQDQIRYLQSQLKNKSQQNMDLFELIGQKNRVIEDITGKIQLLEQAIEEHEKTLTARDGQVQQSFLRQKQYQIHIKNLQSQLEKVIECLNNHKNNNQRQKWQNQHQRLSSEFQEKIQQQKNYYRERIKSMERKFQQQRNLYQIQNRKLQDQIKQYQYKQNELINRISQQKKQKRQLIPNYYEKISSIQYQQESPTFPTLEMKSAAKQTYQVQQMYLNESSTVTLNGRGGQNQRNYDKMRIHEFYNSQQESLQRQRKALMEKNQMNEFASPLLRRSRNLQVNKVSQIESKQVFLDFNQYQNYSKEANIEMLGKQNLDNSDQIKNEQVDNILQRIQKDKSYISKSANKLVNLLENNKV